MALISALLLDGPDTSEDLDDFGLEGDVQESPPTFVKASPKPMTRNTLGRNTYNNHRTSQPSQLTSATKCRYAVTGPSQRSRSRSPRGRVKLKRGTAKLTNSWDWASELAPSVPVELQTWPHPKSGATVGFAAVLMSPLGSSAAEDLQEKIPLAFYYSGLGMTIEDVLEKVSDWRTVVQEPFVLVVPARPKGKWWFIDDDTHWGWIDGEFDPAGVQLFSDWMNFIIEHPKVDMDRVGLCGFSAGAYAATELFAYGSVQFSGIGIGGVHGHGQSDSEDVPKRCRADVVKRFHAFLQRLQHHNGVGWFEATHGYTDQQCRWQDAKQILDAISFRQEFLRLPNVSRRCLSPKEQDTKAGGAKNKTHHDYFRATFLRTEFFVALFGGPHPENVVPSRNVKVIQPSRKERSSSSEPEIGIGPPKPPMQMPPSSLDVSLFSVKVSEPGWEEAAFDIFQEHGFVLVEGLLKLHQYSAVLRDCEEVAESIVGRKKHGNRGSGRYSFGVASSTSSMLHVPSYVRHLLHVGGSTLRPLLDLIFDSGDPPGFSVLSGGGDFVLAGEETYQHLHSDIQVPKHLQKKMPPPLLSVNYCVQALTEENGPTRIIPGKQLAAPPHSEPGDWRRKRLCPVPAGAAFVRDTRTLHGGTPNFSSKTRYLPSIEYVSAEFRATNRSDKFPPTRSLPFDLYEKLPYEIQELCEEIVMEEGQEADVTFKCR